MNFNEFISSKPNLRYLFFGGKGGVGKTVVAAGAAQYFAARGKKTIISSTNPVHSLSSIFKIDIWGKGAQKLTENLYAIEFDISKTTEKYKADMKEKLLTFIKSADIPVDPDPFLDIATTNPAFEEAAMFDDMVNLILEDRFDVYVFDTAPVAHTYRLLGLSKVYDLWLKRLIKSREEALSLKVKLSFRKEKVIEEIKKDPVLQSALETRRRTEEAKKILTDREKTAFFFVTLPLALPIAVIERFITWVKAFDIPIGGVIVNCVLPKTLLRDEKLSSYVVNKLREQDGYLKMINEKFPNLVRAFIPLYETEVIGLDMVDKVADALANGGFNLV
jgi:arsenite-transporting ATPase